MTDFLTSLARRGAGLAPHVSLQPPFTPFGSAEPAPGSRAHGLEENVEGKPVPLTPFSSPEEERAGPIQRRADGPSQGTVPSPSTTETDAAAGTGEKFPEVANQIEQIEPVVQRQTAGAVAAQPLPAPIVAPTMPAAAPAEPPAPLPVVETGPDAAPQNQSPDVTEPEPLDPIAQPPAPPEAVPVPPLPASGEPAPLPEPPHPALPEPAPEAAVRAARQPDGPIPVQPRPAELSSPVALADTPGAEPPKVPAPVNPDLAPSGRPEPRQVVQTPGLSPIPTTHTPTRAEPVPASPTPGPTVAPVERQAEQATKATNDPAPPPQQIELKPAQPAQTAVDHAPRLREVQQERAGEQAGLGKSNVRLVVGTKAPEASAPLLAPTAEHVATASAVLPPPPITVEPPPDRMASLPAIRPTVHTAEQAAQIEPALPPAPAVELGHLPPRQPPAPSVEPAEPATTPEPHPVQIRIGTVEVRAITPPPPRAAPRPAPTSGGFDAYERVRTYGREEY